MKADARIAIVGSGVAAVTVAEILLGSASAHHITMFEAGPPVSMGDARKWLDYLTTDKLPYARNTDLASEVNGDPKKFLVRGGRLIAVGGSTLHWGGWCPRYKPEDFQLNSNTGRGLDWQFGYADLAPFYAKAEQRLQVAGDSARDNPPRFGSSFPIRAVPPPLKDGPVIAALKRLGIGGFGSLPIARNSGCQTTGTCKYCPVSGRYEATMDTPDDSDRFKLRVNAPVIEIIMASKSKAMGLRYRNNESGEVLFEEFDEVIVCAGALESAKLLLASGGTFWSRGLGNDTGHVGRHLIAHSLIGSTGTVLLNPDAIEQELGFPTLECRAFDTPEYQETGKFYFVRDGGDNDIDFAKELIDGRSTREIESQLVGPARYTLSGFVEEFEGRNNRVELGSGISRFGLPNTKILYSTPDVTIQTKLKWQEKMDEVLLGLGAEKTSLQRINNNPRCDHAAATCRMSASAAEGVVDADCRLHDCDNVHICSNAVFPNIGAVNPTLTLTAVAIKMAEAFS